MLILGSSSVASATDIYREPWHWGADIPSVVLPVKPKDTVRRPSDFDHFRFREGTSMREVTAFFGIPDGFAKQFPVTRTEGVPTSHVGEGAEAGTFRYLLRGGGEVLITVKDFHTITLVRRYGRNGSEREIYRR